MGEEGGVGPTCGTSPTHKHGCYRDGLIIIDLPIHLELDVFDPPPRPTHPIMLLWRRGCLGQTPEAVAKSHHNIVKCRESEHSSQASTLPLILPNTVHSAWRGIFFKAFHTDGWVRVVSRASAYLCKDNPLLETSGRAGFDVYV